MMNNLQIRPPYYKKNKYTGVKLRYLKKSTTTNFTLIELFVVIAVIAVLASIIQPVLKQSMESARTVLCSNNFKQLHLAFTHYTSDFERYPYNLGNIDGSGRGGITWDDFLGMGYDGRSLTPRLAKKYGLARVDAGPEVYQKLYQCPQALIVKERAPSWRAYRTYAINVTSNKRGFSNHSSPEPKWSASVSEVPDPKGTILLAEMISGFLGAQGSSGDSNGRYQRQQKTPFHQGEHNYLFADGHSERMFLSDTTQKRNHWTRNPDD